MISMIYEECSECGNDVKDPVPEQILEIYKNRVYAYFCSKQCKEFWVRQAEDY